MPQNRDQVLRSPELSKGAVNHEKFCWADLSLRLCKRLPRASQQTSLVKGFRRKMESEGSIFRVKRRASFNQGAGNVDPEIAVGHSSL